MKFQIGVLVGDEEYFIIDKRSGYVIESGLSRPEAESVADYLNNKKYKVKPLTLDPNESILVIEKPYLPFEDIYEIYPRKIGKASGIKWLEKHIRTKTKFEAVLKAAQQYRDWVKKNGIDEQYVKHFSTWVKTYADWVDNKPSQTITKTQPKSLFPSFER